MKHGVQMFYLTAEPLWYLTVLRSRSLLFRIYTQTCYWKIAIRTAVTSIFIANPAMAIILVNNHEIAYFIRWR